MDPKHSELEAAMVVTLNADGSRTVVCPDGTTVTLKAGHFRGAGTAASPEDRPSPAEVWSTLAA